MLYRLFTLLILLLAAPAWGATNVFVDITGYTHALIPKGHGKIVKLSDGDVYTRYPSNTQNMQMCAFFNSTTGLLVYSRDTIGEVADWAYLGSLNLLRITFYGTEPTVTQVAIIPTVQAAVDGYKLWAMSQSWVTAARAKTNSMGYNLFAIASTPTFSTQLTKLQNLDSNFHGTMAAWLTQYRLHDFDTYYPDYTASNVNDFKSFLSSLKTASIDAFPYLNSRLLDTAYDAFDETGEAVAKRDGSNNKIVYSESLPTLFYACPYSATWRTTIVNARDSLVDSEGIRTPGVYLDLGAVYPHICESSSHGHTAGNAYAHQSGLKTLFGAITGKKIIEGLAEIYIGDVDASLVHLYTDENNNVALFNMVYGDLLPLVGFVIAGDATATKTDQLMKLAESYGQQSHGTPNLTHLVQENLLTEGYASVLKHHFNSQFQLCGTSGSATFANTTFNFTANQASVDFAEIGTLTPYVGHKITITDSASKTLTGFIKSPLYARNAAVDRTTGVAIVSVNGGENYNWLSETSGFNRADESGYTYTIDNTGRPGGSFFDFFRPAQTCEN